MNEILALAAQRDITINNITLVQDNFYTMEGSALRGTMVGGALP
ncbi:MAG: OsmC family peroxiredoxin, partial [Burkholderiales bacterium]|nr:OsmC family peroxiredoxin [Burkholderiales bacterium]